MQDFDQAKFWTGCEKLAGACREILSWKWDSRLEAVLAEFKADKKDDIRKTLARFLPVVWDSSNIDQAPDIVRRISKHLGGLRPGQQLLTTEPRGDALIFCAWWPWGDGKTISVRLAPFCSKFPDPEKAEKIQKLQECFGI